MSKKGSERVQRPGNLGAGIEECLVSGSLDATLQTKPIAFRHGTFATVQARSTVRTVRVYSTIAKDKRCCTWPPCFYVLLVTQMQQVPTTSQVYVAIADLWALRPTALQRYNTTVPRTILSRNALISTGYGDSLRKEERGSDRRKSRGIVQCLEEGAITNPFLSSLPPTGAVQYQYCVLLYTF
jgi:deoxycytidylate deaminase